VGRGRDVVVGDDTRVRSPRESEPPDEELPGVQELQEGVRVVRAFTRARQVRFR
jgi:hypothetical protein